MGESEHKSFDDQLLSLRQIIDSSPALIHTARSDGYIDFFNRTWLDFVGQPAENLLGWEWISYIHPEDVRAFVQKWRESIATGEKFEGTARVRRADGAYRWMLHHKHALRDEDGRIAKWSGSSIDIEECKRSEEQLRRSAQELQRSEFYLAEAQRLGHIGGWVFDPAAGFDYWSHELFQIHGLEPALEAPSAEAYMALVHPEDREAMAALITRMLVDVSEFDVTKRIVRPNGEVRYVRCTGTPVFENGTLKRIGIGIDVTEHELLTQELRRREAYLAEAQRLSHTGSFGWKPDSGEIVWSDETYRIFEYDQATKLTFDLIMERVHPEDRSLVLEIVQRSLNTGIAVDFKHRLLFPDGFTKHVRVLAKPLGFSGNRLELIGAVIDITEAERTEQRIRNSERELRTIIEIMPAYVATTLPDGTVDFVNQSWLDYTGFTREEAMGWGWAKAIHPDDLVRVSSNWGTALSEEKPLEQEVRCRKADGTYHWFLNRNLPLRDESGNVVKWYGILFDIDDRKRTEDRLRDARVKLNNASRVATIAELSTSIAHELNQPLMSVFANAQTAKRWLRANPPNLAETNASIERVVRDAHAADELMQHIRALFEPGAFDKKEVGVPDMLSEAVRFVHEDPNKREVPIDCLFDEHLPTISVDLTQIQQVFINLISNAIEAMEGRQILPRVMVRASATDQNQVLIQVIDNGPGVADAEKIFHAFVTTKKNGMGIGLAVSRSIVEAHGGRLWAENNQEGGATFNVALPLCSVHWNPASSVGA
jgi:PAS domain S-box-containing protein